MRDVTNRGTMNFERVRADETRRALATADIVNVRTQPRACSMVTLGDSSRHCEERSDEAIHRKQRELDCFASLAMTSDG